ncbi:TPA: dihydroneopterin aldolase [Campylobacter jejuni]|nr:dihydroneopterin aldolase [Campylobacter jejuni]
MFPNGNFIFPPTILIIKKPEKENLAFGLVMVAWLLMVFFYVGHKTGALLTIMNL